MKVNRSAASGRVAGSGSKIQDFMMILLAMFDSSVLNVGAKFTS